MIEPPEDLTRLKPEVHKALEITGETEPLWTVGEVAKYLRLEPETVRAMAREGKMPAIKLGRVWRFRSSTVITWLAEQES